MNKYLLTILLLLFQVPFYVQAQQNTTAVKKEKKEKNEPNKHGHKQDNRTKTGDPVVKNKKGPHGETVYLGEKGGHYYLNKGGNKVYIKD